MSFLAPARLLFVLLPVGALLWYAIALRMRKRHAVRFADISLLDSVAPDRPGWRRHLAAVAFVLALLAFVLAFARPVMAVAVPVEQARLVLVLDVSFSMAADDVSPTRIDASREAALSFLELAPGDLEIGVVAFSGVAVPAVVPTTDREIVATAIEGLALGEGTAIGEGIYAGLEMAVTEDDMPSALVVLSDGETTVGRSEVDAASEAATLGIPVSTIAFGTQAGTIFFQDQVVPVPVNEGALRDVARQTGGTFSEAASAEEFEAILDNVGSELSFETEEREVWEWFLAGGIVALTLAGATSLLWFQRLP